MKEGRNDLGGGTLAPGTPRAAGQGQFGAVPLRGRHSAGSNGTDRIAPAGPTQPRVEQARAKGQIKQQPEESLAPLYERLPRGPHQLKPREVAENQRNRMHGAMVEAIAANGYGRTSVKQIVSLAGVSRRAFYEQFANKQECFLATLDLISSRMLEEISDAYRSADGGLEQRMGAALERFAAVVQDNPKSARVLMIDAPSAGPAGWIRLAETFTALESMIATSFTQAPDTAPLPTPVARAIVGGLRRVTLMRLRGQRTEEMPGLVEDMLQWVLIFRTTTPLRLGDPARKSAYKGGPPLSANDASRTSAHMRAGASSGVASSPHDRARLLSSALELAELEGYGNVTPLRIADEAGVSIDVFFELFADMEECFLAALGEVGKELRATLRDAELTTPQWPNAVRRVLSSLTRCLATHPSYGHAIATGVFTMGEHAVELTADLARDIVSALIEGAPGPARSELAQEGIEGAIWHTIFCQATHRRADLLPTFSDDLAYVVLASFMGAEAAARAMRES